MYVLVLGMWAQAFMLPQQELYQLSCFSRLPASFSCVCVCAFSFFSHVAQLRLALPMKLRLTLNSWAFYLFLLMLGMHYHGWLYMCFGCHSKRALSKVIRTNSYLFSALKSCLFLFPRYKLHISLIDSVHTTNRLLPKCFDDLYILSSLWLFIQHWTET